MFIHSFGRFIILFIETTAKVNNYFVTMCASDVKINLLFIFRYFKITAFHRRYDGKTHHFLQKYVDLCRIKLKEAPR